MARRRTRSKTPRRRTPRTFNVASALEAGLIANAVTQGFFNTDLKTFFFNKDGGISKNRAQNLNQITIRELIAGVTGGTGGYGTTMTGGTAPSGISLTLGKSFGQTIRDNLNTNGGQMVASLVLIPVGFKVVSKLTSKPRALTNKAAKMAGLPVRV